MHGTCLYRSHLKAVTEKEQVTSRCLAWERDEGGICSGQCHQSERKGAVSYLSEDAQTREWGGQDGFSAADKVKNTNREASSRTQCQQQTEQSTRTQNRTKYQHQAEQNTSTQ